MVSAIRAGGGHRRRAALLPTTPGPLRLPQAPAGDAAPGGGHPGPRPLAQRPVGDHLTDLQAARAAGCGAILVLTGRGRVRSPLLAADPGLATVPVYADPRRAVAAILEQGAPA